MYKRQIESCGALVVADRYCYGSFPGRQEIVLTDGEDALTQVCRWYLQHTECPVSYTHLWISPPRLCVYPNSRPDR